jgi:hypothetical protein
MLQPSLHQKSRHKLFSLAGALSLSKGGSTKIKGFGKLSPNGYKNL